LRVGDVEEFCPKFQPFKFGQRQFLLNTQIGRAQTGAADRAHTASSKCARIGRRIRGSIEPLEATELFRERIESGLSTKNVRRRDAIGARPSRVGARGVRRTASYHQHSLRLVLFFFTAVIVAAGTTLFHVVFLSGSSDQTTGVFLRIFAVVCYVAAELVVSAKLKKCSADADHQAVEKAHPRYAASS
jgi:hypothetical protein